MTVYDHVQCFNSIERENWRNSAEPCEVRSRLTPTRRWSSRTSRVPVCHAAEVLKQDTMGHHTRLIPTPSSPVDLSAECPAVQSY